MGSEVHLSVDRDLCIGAGLCMDRFPSVFEQDDDEGLVQLRDDGGDGHTFEELSVSQFECPAQAILVSLEPQDGSQDSRPR